MTECHHSFIHQIIIEHLLHARNFAVKKLIFTIRKKDMDPAFMEFTVQLGDWQMNNNLSAFGMSFKCLTTLTLPEPTLTPPTAIITDFFPLHALTGSPHRVKEGYNDVFWKEKEMGILFYCRILQLEPKPPQAPKMEAHGKITRPCRECSKHGILHILKGWKKERGLRSNHAKKHQKRLQEATYPGFLGHPQITFSFEVLKANLSLDMVFLLYKRKRN